MSLLNRVPDQIRRLAVILLLLIILFSFARYYLIPEDFGVFGHFRASSVELTVNQPLRYAGQRVCRDCHEDVVDMKAAGGHDGVSCEICHGPGIEHVEGSGEELRIPEGRDFCLRCHEYLNSRPTGFPQVISRSHNPVIPCVDCHDPHDPVPPSEPSNCEACHAEIAHSKAGSKHAYVGCTRCHQGGEAHMSDPRQVFAGKPIDRAFCGECHGLEADAGANIPRVDIESHEENYLCWQCHYPHLPEVK